MATEKKYAPFIIRKYRLITYDVWGNARDGWEVNNSFSTGTVVEIKCKLVVHNAGTPHEFASYAPTDRQLSRSIGEKGLVWDGSGAPDEPQYAEYRNGKPACELRPEE